MLNVFSKKKSLTKSDFFFNFTDCHSHILPAVDDGIRNIEKALRVLDEYERMGVKNVVMTPHIMESYAENDYDFLTSEFENFKGIYKGNISLRLAAEYMLDNEFDKHLNSGKLLTIVDNYLLVETSYLLPPMNLRSTLRGIKSKGYNIILAHVERYGYMDIDYLKGLKDMEILFQLNLLSLAGYYGKHVQEQAFKILDLGMYNLAGSDIHHLTSFTEWIKKIHLSSKQFRLLGEINEQTQRLLF